MSGSLCLNFIVKIYTTIIIYYENSLSHKAALYISGLCKNSIIVVSSLNLFTKHVGCEFTKGSAVFKFVYGFLDFVISALKRVFSFFVGLSQGSISRDICVNIIAPLNNFGRAFNAMFCLLSGFFFIRCVFIIVLYGFNLNVVLLNFALFTVFFALSFINPQKITSSVENSSFKKLVLWFFNS